MTMSSPLLSPRPRDSPRPAQPRSSRSTSKSKSSPFYEQPPSLPAGFSTPRQMNEFRTPGIVQQDVKTPSPNYFGLAVHSNADVFASSAAQHIRGNWSPPSSNVRSTAAASPRVVPLDQNPDFELFRRQSDKQGTFTLGGKLGDLKAPPRLTPSAGPVKTPPTSIPSSLPNETVTGNKEEGSSSSPKPRSPKRLLSADSSLFPEQPRRNSPASFLNREGRSEEVAQFADDRHSRPSLPPTRSSRVHTSHRAETLPAQLEGDGKPDTPVFVTPQHVVTLLESAGEEILLLDLRVATQYAKSRITSALSLCIPTTLLKRASFNVQKLAETFTEDEHREKFESWRSSRYIIVYDQSSSQFKDAATCINTLKKFSNEGWAGGSYIIRGGFSEFANKFPSLVTHDLASNRVLPKSGGLKLESLPSVAPVIGGCPMPTSQNPANPFFGNIRQNMDLIGGVGQMPVKLPASMTPEMAAKLPSWLREASNAQNNGKAVSDKFLSIERREQKRMQEALSGRVVYGTAGQSDSSKAVQIAGIEKGSKNRYNSIWPYEHSRVKLKNVSEGGCDYINANHVKPPGSHKRYIATQGPLPETFNVSPFTLPLFESKLCDGRVTNLL